MAENPLLPSSRPISSQKQVSTLPDLIEAKHDAEATKYLGPGNLEHPVLPLTSADTLLEASDMGDVWVAGADRVLAMDLHSGQCVGYFDIPVDHVYGDSVILDYLASKRISSGDLVRFLA